MYHREQFIKAVIDFNEGRYAECHDSLESLWVGSQGVYRRFLQGMLQMEFGARHLRQGYYDGAFHQFSRALPKFGNLPADYMGIDLDALRAQLRTLLELIGKAPGREDLPSGPFAIPSITVLEEPILPAL